MDSVEPRFNLNPEIEKRIGQYGVSPQDLEAILKKYKSQVNAAYRTLELFRASRNATNTGVKVVHFRKFCGMFNDHFNWNLTYGEYCHSDQKEQLMPEMRDEVARLTLLPAPLVPPSARSQPNDAPVIAEDVALDATRPCANELTEVRAEQGLAASSDSLTTGLNSETRRTKLPRPHIALFVFTVVLIAILPIRSKIQRMFGERTPVDASTIHFDFVALQKGQDESVPVQKASLPLTEGDAVQFRISAREPMYSYVLWLDPKGELSPVWPWKNMSWDSDLSAKSVLHASIPEGSEHFVLSNDASGIHAVFCLLSRRPINDFEAIRASVSKIGMAQQGLAPIDDQLCIKIENGMIAPINERFPLSPHQTKDPLSPVNAIRKFSQQELMRYADAVEVLVFAFGPRDP